MAKSRALREVSSKQLAVCSKTVAGSLPASCPLSYFLLPLLSTQHSLLSTESALRLCGEFLKGFLSVSKGEISNWLALRSGTLQLRIASVAAQIVKASLPGAYPPQIFVRYAP